MSLNALPPRPPAPAADAVVHVSPAAPPSPLPSPSPSPSPQAWQALKAQEGRMQASHDRLEIEVAERTAQLTELTQHLQTAREDERARLARDLHDELGALLTSAKLDVARLRARLQSGAPEALERLSHLSATLDTVIALKRRIIEDLRPSSLAHLGLNVALDNLATDFQQRANVPVHLALSDDTSLSPAAELVAYRLVQEALTNISNYAQARQVWVTLAAWPAPAPAPLAAVDGGAVVIHTNAADAADAAAPPGVVLSVRDDGVGFDTGLRLRSAYGLVGMRFRVEAEGGTLAVASAPGQGCCITMRLPVSVTAAA